MLVTVAVAVALLDELGLAVAVAVAVAVALLVPEGVDCALPLGTAVVVGSALELT